MSVEESGRTATRSAHGAHATVANLNDLSESEVHYPPDVESKPQPAHSPRYLAVARV